MRMTRTWARDLLAALFATLLPFAAGAAEPELVKVVTLMRHGVRPPTESTELRHYTDRAWPDWPVADGQLTPHGAAAVGQLGRWERAHYAARGLLPMDGCPAPGLIFTWANRGYARTIDTGKAMLDAMFPGCGLAVGIAPGKGHDPIFTARQTEVGRMDPKAAESAILEKMGGSFDRPRRELAPMLVELDALLGCCATRLCPGAAGSCTFADLPWGIRASGGGGNVDLVGPLNVGSTMAQVFLLQYMEGLPVDQLAWGRAARVEDVIRLSAIRKLKYEYMERVPFIARHGSSNIARQIAIALEQEIGGGQENRSGPPGAARLVLFVGSDTQIAELGALLDAHWSAPPYLDDETPPGGGLSFELLRDETGRFLVSVLFLAQTPDQVRNVAVLDATNSPVRTVVHIPGCGTDPCPAEFLLHQLRTSIESSAVSEPAYAR